MNDYPEDGTKWCAVHKSMIQVPATVVGRKEVNGKPGVALDRGPGYHRTAYQLDRFYKAFRRINEDSEQGVIMNECQFDSNDLHVTGAHLNAIARLAAEYSAKASLAAGMKATVSMEDVLEKVVSAGLSKL